MRYWVIWNIFPTGWGDKKKRLLPQTYENRLDAMREKVRLKESEKCVPAKYRQEHFVMQETPDKATRIGRILIKSNMHQ